MNATTPDATRHGLTLDERRAPYLKYGLSVEDATHDELDLLDLYMEGVFALRPSTPLAERAAATESVRAALDLVDKTRRGGQGRDPLRKLVEKLLDQLESGATSPTALIDQ